MSAPKQQKPTSAPKQKKPTSAPKQQKPKSAPKQQKPSSAPKQKKPPGLPIITRAQWGAKDPNDNAELGPLKPTALPAVKIAFDYTCSDICYEEEKCFETLQDIQYGHKEAGFADIMSNFLIGGKGQIYEGRGWDIRPESFFGFDHDKTIEIAYICQGPDDPLPAQIESAKKLIKFGIKCNKIKVKHREFWRQDEGTSDFEDLTKLEV